MIIIYFFFSSRRRHTRSLRDWSSTCALPICKSTLVKVMSGIYSPDDGEYRFDGEPRTVHGPNDATRLRSEERRVGKESRWRWAGEGGGNEEQWWREGWDC